MNFYSRCVPDAMPKEEALPSNVKEVDIRNLGPRVVDDMIHNVGRSDTPQALGGSMAQLQPGTATDFWQNHGQRPVGQFPHRRQVYGEQDALPKNVDQRLPVISHERLTCSCFKFSCVGLNLDP